MTSAIPPVPRKNLASDAALSGQVLDEALEDSFPASDPLASSPKRGGKDDKRVEVTGPADDTVTATGTEPETTDAKTPSNMAVFHKTFERRRR